MPDRGIHHIRIGGVEHKVYGSRRIAPEQDVAPGLPPVRCLENPTLPVGTVHVPESSHIDDFGIAGMNAHAPDLSRISESGEGPRLPGVSGFEDAIPMRHVAADRRLSRAYVNDVGIRFAHGDRTNCPAEILIGYRSPRHPGVGGLEDSTARRAEIVFHRSRRRPRRGDGSSSTERADLAPSERG